MKNFLLIIFLAFGIQSLSAQDLFEDKNNIFQNENGKVISAITARDMLYGSNQRYELKRSVSSDGKSIIRLMPISEKQFWKSINADKKKVKKLKGTKMIGYSLPDRNNKTVTNKTVSDKLTVYNFWYTGCRPCLVEIPQLNELVEKYKDQVNFIAPTFESSEKVNRFLSKRTFDYNTLSNGTEFVKQLNVTSYPTHMIVDKDGTILDVVIGGSETIGMVLDKSIASNLKK